jgi:hypothetical protein
MADVIVNLGQCFTATPTPQVYRFKWPYDAGNRRGSVKVKGGTRVIFGWDKAPAVIDDSDEADKGYCDSLESIRIPRKCNWFVAVTASGSSKCILIED